MSIKTRGAHPFSLLFSVILVFQIIGIKFQPNMMLVEMLAPMYFLCLLILGLSLGAALFLLRCTTSEYPAPPSNSRLLAKSEKSLFYWLNIFFIIAIVLIIFDNPPPLISLGMGLFGEYDVIMSARAESLSNEDSRLLRFVFYDFSLLLTIFACLLRNGGYITRPSFAFFIVFYLILSTVYLHKGPALLQLVAIGYVFYVVSVKKNVILPLLLIVAIFAVASLFYWFFSGYINFDSLLNRIVGVYVQSGFFVLETFPHNMNYLFGSSFPNPFGIFPFESFNLSHYTHWQVNGMKGNAPVPAVFEFYSNAGLAGVLIGSFVVSAYLFMLSSWGLLNSRSYAVQSIFLFLVVKSSYIANTSFFVAFDFFVITLLLIFLLFVLAKNQIPYFNHISR